MKYKLIEDKNGTIVLGNGKRYSMSRLEYTKDDLIDIQNDYDILYKKLYAQDKIINSQALEIARLKGKSEILEENNKLLIQQKQQMYEDLDIAYDKIDKAIEEINYMITNADITEIGAIKLKQILGDKENE